MPTLATFQSWRQDLAERLETAAAVLGAILFTDGIHEDHVVRIRGAADSLLATARGVRAGARATSVLTLGEITHRLHDAMRLVRVVLRWHGVTSDTALEDLALVLDDLEDVVREAATLVGLGVSPEGHAHA